MSKNHTAQSTFRAIDQIHNTLKNLVNNEFLSDEDNTTIYAMYNDMLSIWHNSRRKMIESGISKALSSKDDPRAMVEPIHRRIPYEEFGRKGLELAAGESDDN